MTGIGRSLHPVLVENVALEMLRRNQSLMSTFCVTSFFLSLTSRSWLLVNAIWTHRSIIRSLVANIVITSLVLIKNSLFWSSAGSKNSIWFTLFFSFSYDVRFGSSVTSSGIMSLFNTRISMSCPCNTWLLLVVCIICALSLDFILNLSILNRPLVVTGI